MGKDKINNPSSGEISEESKTMVRNLAQRIYDLDSEVYKAVGSSLGRTFNGDKKAAIDQLYRLILTNPQGYRLRSEIALVGNMARTIRDKSVKAQLMTEYNEILKETKKIPLSFGNVDIIDETLANLNSSNFGHTMSKEDHLIICISRTEGSAGTDIGFALADALHINYYDAEVFRDVLRKIDDEKDVEWKGVNKAIKHKRARAFSRYHGLSMRDAAFFNESEILCNMSKEQDFIVVGRCADAVLINNHIPHISVFITAPFEQRAKRIMELEGVSYKKASRILQILDKKRERFYNFYTGKVSGNASNYDLCINSASYGIKEAVDLILRVINMDSKGN